MNPESFQISLWDILIFVAFVVTVVSVGLYQSRSEKGSEDYFLAGRDLKWWLIGFSLIASNISTEQFVGMSGNAASHVGLAIASYEWMAAITLVIVAFAFLPYFLRTGHLHHAGVPGGPVQRHGAHDHGRGHDHDLPAPAGSGHLLGRPGHQHAGGQGGHVREPGHRIADHRRHRHGLRHGRGTQGMRLGRPDPGQRAGPRRRGDPVVRVPEARDGHRGGFGRQRRDRSGDHPGSLPGRGGGRAVLGPQPAPHEHVPARVGHDSAVDRADDRAVDPELLLLGPEPVHHAADPGLGLAGRGAEGHRLRGPHEAPDPVRDRRPGDHRLQSVLERHAPGGSRRHGQQHGRSTWTRTRPRSSWTRPNAPSNEEMAAWPTGRYLLAVFPDAGGHGRDRDPKSVRAADHPVGVQRHAGRRVHRIRHGGPVVGRRESGPRRGDRRVQRGGAGGGRTRPGD